MSWASVLNAAWMGKCQPELWAFQRTCRSVAGAQSSVLQKILFQNRTTVYGKEYCFREIQSPADYQHRVPVTEHESYAPYLERIAEGEPGILTADPVLLFEPTSGSTKGEKLIPYTASLRKQFQRGVAAWIADLLKHRPGVRRGRAFWSLSPALGRLKRTEGRIPVGFEDDTAYLSGLERWFVSKLLAVPPQVARQNEIQNFRYCTLAYLLQAKDLSLISIWSPTFLTSLLASLDEWTDRLIHDFSRGCLTLPFPVPEQPSPTFSLRAGRNSHRANDLKSILQTQESLPEKFNRLWPRLQLISCWTDAAAAGYITELQQLFPAIEIQPKGLLATEGFVSFPLVGLSGCALALRSHFFEFVEEQSPAATTEREQYLLAHELALGRNYRVLLTTGGGFYRYELHDLIQVVGFHRECPLVRFLGKTNLVSDLVGEKLNEAHVRDVLKRVFAQHGWTPAFALLVPVEDRPPYYLLYIQGPIENAPPDFRVQMAWAVEQGLKENAYYSQAIQLGQLSGLRVEWLEASEDSAWRIYERGCMARGQKWGDIKPTTLDPRHFWNRDFAPLLRKPPGG